METSIVSKKGQIIIPARLRKKYGFQPGKKIAFFEENDCITLKLMDESFFSQYAGMLKETVPTKEEYQQWKNEELEKEEQKLSK